jgi:RimJ/RimL family protein N-acetyltransferase
VGLRAWVAARARSQDPLFFAVVADGGPGGVATLMRIAPEMGTIEIGWICLGPRLQRTTAASEMVFLLADAAFAAGYRRLGWKCDALNAPSRRAAARFGFRYEGTFRQHMVIKGRSRDTAWFAITDGDWRGGLAAACAAWLEPGNFDAAGRQRRRLGALTAPWARPADAAGADPAADD